MRPFNGWLARARGYGLGLGRILPMSYVRCMGASMIEEPLGRENSAQPYWRPQGAFCDWSLLGRLLLLIILKITANFIYALTSLLKLRLQNCTLTPSILRQVIASPVAVKLSGVGIAKTSHSRRPHSPTFPHYNSQIP